MDSQNEKSSSSGVEFPKPKPGIRFDGTGMPWVSSPPLPALTASDVPNEDGFASPSRKSIGILVVS